MKSIKEIKYLLQNSTINSDRFFFNNYESDFSRVGLLDSEIHNGIGILKNGDEVYIYTTLNGEDEIISTDIPEFYRVQVFLDQFRDVCRPLPNIDPDMHPLRKQWYASENDLKKAMQIMLMPLNSYENFIDNIRLVEETFNRTITYPEIELGDISTWSWGDTQVRDGCITVNQLLNEKWQILYWERGSSKVALTMFDRKHVYEYFMNIYLEVV